LLSSIHSVFVQNSDDAHREDMARCDVFTWL